MRVTLRTDAPRFANELYDVVRLFDDDAVPSDDGELLIEHTDAYFNGERVSDVRLSGMLSAESTRRQVIQADALIDKRLHKRQVKLALYDCLKSAYRASPPWGSLTGVRPTRLVYARMAGGDTIESAVEGVQNTFDLSEEKARLLEKTIAAQQTLPTPTPSDVDLYVGIPFCVTRCAYCSFISAEVGDGAMLLPYAEAVSREIEDIHSILYNNRLRARAVYVGGGTPTALPAHLLERVLNAARHMRVGAAEMTIEAGRPDTIDRDKLTVIKEAGATRLSINPQTMHDSTLRLIGRAHTRAQTEKAFAMARDMGFDNINMDVIAGLPGERTEDFAATLDWVRDLAPESLTVHTLSIKRASLLHLWKAKLPDGAMVAEMTRLGARRAADMGMRPYYLYRQKHMAGNQENVGYALPGRECLYNVDMMEETTHILAAGAGGISKRVTPSGGKIERAPNVSDIYAYILRVEDMMARKRALWGDVAAP